MKVLVLEKRLVEATKLGAVAQDAGHQVTMAANETIATTALADASISAMVLAVHGPDEQLLAFAKTCRDTNPKLLIALLASNVQEDYLTRAYDAGIDLELPQGSAAMQLSRLRALGSLAHLAQPKPAAPKPVAGKTGDVLLQTTQSEAWRTLPKNMAGAVSTFLSLPVAVGALPDNPGAMNHGSVITLANVEQQIEIRIAIGSDAASATRLAVHMFGEGEDLVADMLNEIANMFMGTTKATLAAESIPYTGGLPAALDPGMVLRPAGMYQQQTGFVLQVSDARLVVHVGVRSKANILVAPTALGEGMVLAKDVVNGRGVMLVTAGTRLSSSMVDRLRTSLDAKVRVEVMAP